MKKTTVFALVLSGFAGFGVIGNALAQTYPTKPIRVIVPFPAGGGTDIVARIVTDALGKTLNAQLIVDNRGGAGGIVGTDLAAKSTADGYTTIIVSGSHAINPSLHDKLPYDSVRDFTPISMLVSAPGLLVVHPSLPVSNVKQLIALATEKPGVLNYATAGNGTPPHLAAKLFEVLTKVRMVHVPYKGNSQAMTDLVAGRVPVSFPTIPSVLSHVKANRLRALAVTSEKRSAVVPEYPTIAESGVPEYSASSWYGMLAPAGIPTQVTATLSKAIVKAMQTPEVRQKLEARGVDPVGNLAKEFDLQIKNDIKKWAMVVKEADVKVE